MNTTPTTPYNSTFPSTSTLQQADHTATTDIHIPIAGFKEVYDVKAVERALGELPASASEGLRHTYEKMIKLGGTRFIVKPSHVPDMTALYHDLPNFSEVLNDVCKQIVLCSETNDPLEITPMLLLGDPGIGKTHFAKRLSALLGTHYGFVGMSSVTAGWILSGSSSQWKNAKPGKVFETLVYSDYANPVMVIDEIDKAANDGQYDPLGALYSLLEYDTAKEFADEYAEVPIDARDVIWVATANDVRHIPDPILNRMNVYNIERPDYAAACNIAAGIYTEIRNAHQWGSKFPDHMHIDTLDKLAGVCPREMRRLIMNGFGTARMNQRYELLADDIQTEKNAQKRRIGF
jgi:ATP-dependent Lon protease